MRKTLLSTLAVALLLGSSNAGLAQVAPAGGLKTLVTISFAGYDELLANVEFVGKLGGSPNLAKSFEGLIQQSTQGKGLAGLDTEKPWGAVVRTDGQQFPAVGFVPVTDLKQLLAVLSPLFGEAEDAGGGVLKIEPAAGELGPTLYVKQQGGWAFIGDSPEALANLPADPLKELGGLNQKYVLAARASVKNVPPAIRAAIKQNLELGAAGALPRLPGESNEDYAIRTGVAKRMIEQAFAELNDLDEVLIGWALDRQGGTSHLDFEVTAVAGSKTAAQFAEMTSGKTNFAGFELPGAAVTGNWAATLTDSDVTEAKAALAELRTEAIKNLEDQGLSEAELKLATQLLGDLLDVLEKTIENKQADGGLVLLLKPGATTFAAGSTIGDGDKLENVLKQLAQLATQENPDLADALKLDAETHGNVRFHRLSVPWPPEEEAAKVFGEKIEVVVGINNQTLYLAAGSDPAGTLKQVIDKSKAEPGKQVPPVRFSVALTPIMKLAAAAAEDGMGKFVAELVAAELAKSAGQDHLNLTYVPIPNGARLRLQIEKGVLTLIGSAPKLQEEIMKKVMEQMMGPGGLAPGESPF